MKQIKIIHLYLPFAFCFLLSCRTGEIKHLALDGDLYAKNLIEIRCDLPDQAEDIEYSWYLAPSPDGKWEKIQGIWTDKIVLLTSYVNKYLKCEISCRINGDEIITASVISSHPVEYRGNPNTDWFRDAGFGIMVHYLKPVIVPEGGAKEWNDAVNSFDVEKFASQAKDADVGFVMFTLGQNSGYYCSPNATFDSIVGVNPGDLCSKRDLPKDLIAALGKRIFP